MQKPQPQPQVPPMSGQTFPLNPWGMYTNMPAGPANVMAPDVIQGMLQRNPPMQTDQQNGMHMDPVMLLLQSLMGQGI